MTTYFTTDITLVLADLQAVGYAGIAQELFDTVSAQAISVVETVTGVFFEADYREINPTVADAAWLKKSAVYQIAYMIENPDIFNRSSVTSLSQDGVSASATDELTFVLAPLAKRALANCTWSKSETILVSTEDTVVFSDPLVSDDHPWNPLGGN